MEEGYEDLDRDLSYRIFTGEDYDDGQSTEEIRKYRDGARDALDEEERRQQAQFRFGMRDKPPPLRP